MMDAMNTKDIDDFRHKLLHLKRQLEEIEATSRDATRTVELDQQSVGRLSRMDAMQAQQMAMASAERRRQQLLKIEGALRRIESGDYGQCFVCGDDIDRRRLSADPTHTRCTDCADG